MLHQLFAECLLRVEPEALSGLGAAGAARPLVGGGFGDGGDEERLDPDARIVHLMREVIRGHQRSSEVIRERLDPDARIVHLMREVI